MILSFSLLNKEMDHFNIEQICSNCLRGSQTFRVDLSLYEADGKLREGVDEMEQFCFICRYCWKTTSLNFYDFSHPSMILHLMHLKRQNERRKEALDKLNMTFK